MIPTGVIPPDDHAELIIDIGIRRAISLIRRGKPDAARIALEVAAHAADAVMRGTR